MFLEAKFPPLPHKRKEYPLIIFNHKTTDAKPRCPGCQSLLNGATSVSTETVTPPQTGDLSVCVYCCLLLTFNSDLSPRVLKDKEYAELPEEVKQRLEVVQHMLELRRP